ncbi:MAG: hypothetical protein ACRDSR_02800 [Pseudonocardiaceae bacterium]
MTNTAIDIPATHSPTDPALSPGEALAALFLANADNGRNTENDVFVEELLTRRRAIQAPTAPSGL